MYKEIDHNLYCIEVPLPDNPLKAINCYLIRGRYRSLLIDTGMNRRQCREALFAVLHDLGIESSDLDIFITHVHFDHMGLISKLASPSSTCFWGLNGTRIDTSMTTNAEHWLHECEKNGYPAFVLDQMFRVNSTEDYYGDASQVLMTTVVDGHVLKFGDYNLKCIETPGHCPGHMCLYEAQRKLLFSGDQILFNVTPHIQLYDNTPIAAQSHTSSDSLREYLASLDKVGKIEVAMVWPGHGRPSAELAARVAELKTHHSLRLDELRAVLRTGDKTAYEVASYLTWKANYIDFNTLPFYQMFFAVGETLAHLRYLQDDGEVKNYVSGKQNVFALN